MTAGAAGDCAGLSTDVVSQARSAEQMATARRLLLAGGSRPELDRIARLAARLLNTTSAQVSLLTEVQTVAGGTGLPSEVRGSASPLSDSLCTVTATCGDALVVPDAHRDQRVSGLLPVRSGAVGSYLGVPLTAENGENVGALCVFDPGPHAWSDADVAVLTQLAESVVSELELSALTRQYETSRVRWELAVEAAGVGSFDWDLLTGKLSWDDTLLALLGYDTGTFNGTIEAFNARVHPDDLPRVSRAWRDAIDSVSSFDTEYRVLLPDGVERWVQARGRVLSDEHGRAIRILGAALDTTDMREGEAKLARVLESMSAAFIALDRDWRITYVNAEAERMVATEREDLLGGLLWELFPATVGADFETMYRKAVATGEPATLEAYYPAPLNAWYEVRASPAPDGLSLYFLDVSARRAAQELEQLAVRAGEQLSRAREVDEIIGALARVVVPQLADWSIVSRVGSDRSGPRCWHVDPELVPVVERFMNTRFDGRQAAEVELAQHAGPPVVLPAAAAESVGPALVSATAGQALENLGPASSAAVPLSVNGHMIGVLELWRGKARPPLSAQELAAAAGIADRAALAVENARLHAEQRATSEQLRTANRALRVVAEHDRSVARALQEAMITRLPEPDRLQLAARYLTATGTEQVGGDWYDALVHADGTTTAVIGDVAGHDIAAAAMMGQLRNMLRALDWAYPADPPAQVISRLDRAGRDLGLKTLASLLLLHVEPPATGSERATLRWSNAGHPAPVLLGADGVATLLERPPDLLFGVDPDRPRHDHVQQAPWGSTLLLYTDGLIESRHHDIDHGQRRLLDLLRDHHSVPIDELLDAVLTDLIDDHNDDDVAILAVHLDDGPAGVM